MSPKAPKPEGEKRRRGGGARGGQIFQRMLNTLAEGRSGKESTYVRTRDPKKDFSFKKR